MVKLTEEEKAEWLKKFDPITQQVYITDSMLGWQQKYPNDQRIKEDARVNKDKVFEMIKANGFKWRIHLDNWNDGKAQFLNLWQSEIELQLNFLILANWFD